MAGDREAYFAGFDGLPSLRTVVERGWLYEGQMDPGYGASRGTPPNFSSWGNLVYCLQNHDQVGNRAFGERLTTTADEGAFRALTMLLLLLPATPMLFQGQEFRSARPFLYFTDHAEDLAEAIRDGRRAEFARFTAFADPKLRERIPNPQDPRTFERSKLEPPGTRDPRSALFEDFHRALLQLRHSDPVLSKFRQARLPIEARLGNDLLTVRFVAGDSERMLALNVSGSPVKCELPRSGSWRCAFNSDDAAFGGFGAGVAIEPLAARVPPRAGVLLAR